MKGDGTKNNPFVIETPTDLDAVRNNLTAHYTLGNDIDMNVAPYNTGFGFVPIGGQSFSPEGEPVDWFTGRFDGKDKVIRNLYVNATNECGGLFGAVGDTVLKNITLENSNIEGGRFVGALSGIGDRTHSYNIRVIGGTIQDNPGDKYNYIGGVYGVLRNGGVVKNSRVSATASSTDSKNYIGGMVGRLDNSLVEQSRFTGSGSTLGVLGGVVGYGKIAQIRFSYSTGTLNAANGGGVLGELDFFNELEEVFFDGIASGGLNVFFGDGGSGVAHLKSCYSTKEGTQREGLVVDIVSDYSDMKLKNVCWDWIDAKPVLRDLEYRVGFVLLDEEDNYYTVINDAFFKTDTTQFFYLGDLIDARHEPVPFTKGKIIVVSDEMTTIVDEKFSALENEYRVFSVEAGHEYEVPNDPKALGRKGSDYYKWNIDTESWDLLSITEPPNSADFEAYGQSTDSISFDGLIGGELLYLSDGDLYLDKYRMPQTYKMQVEVDPYRLVEAAFINGKPIDMFTHVSGSVVPVIVAGKDYHKIGCRLMRRD